MGPNGLPGPPGVKVSSSQCAEILFPSFLQAIVVKKFVFHRVTKERRVLASR